MSSLAPVCILAAGKGTRMGALSSINKSLIPFQNEAVLSQIMKRFPSGTAFVIALGYAGDQVKEYINAAHPHLSVHYVNVDPYEGKGSGPGYSLLSCKSLLQRPFYFISCDTLFEGDLSVYPNCNWVAVSQIAKEEQASYCNMVLGEENRVASIFDKKETDQVSHAFIGLMHIQDYSLFWEALENNTHIAGEHQISNGLQRLLQDRSLYAVSMKWTDVGTYEKYHAAVSSQMDYDFSKTNEHLYFVNERVIKFFSDPSIVSARVKKSALKPSVFPALSYTGSHFYAYPFVQGKTLYAENSPDIFSKLLFWLENQVWTPVDVPEEEMQKCCCEFYQEKTVSRLNAFAKKYPTFRDPVKVNGEKIKPISELMDALPWHILCQGVPVFMHGDLQFDNILYDEKTGRFSLLDWRQDFSGKVEFGDIYYDFAKLLGGIILNYDYIKAGLFRFNYQNNEMVVDFAQRFLGEVYKKQLKEFIEKKHFDFNKVELLVGLIYLNMAPLHHPPFDYALYGLGALFLTRALS